MPIEIAPALEPEEWKDRRFGAISRDAIEGSGDEFVVIIDPDGRETSVSGPNELFALIALANDALPKGDPRKLSRGDVEWFRMLAKGEDMWEVESFRAWCRRMGQVLAALLPPGS